jgi:1,4-alpha-glucan branching enzyme
MPWQLVSFIQNHDQIGNRARGERISHLTRPEALRAATTALLLAPAAPMLFMGQEWAATSPFLFFCDFEPDLALKVTKGRRREFSSFAAFTASRQRARIPDPNKEETFFRSKLKWQEIEKEEHREWLLFHKELLQLRHKKIAPLLDILETNASYRKLNPFSLRAAWPLRDGRKLVLLLNLGEQQVDNIEFPQGECLRRTGQDNVRGNILPAFFCGWYLCSKDLV